MAAAKDTSTTTAPRRAVRSARAVSKAGTSITSDASSSKSSASKKPASSNAAAKRKKASKRDADDDDDDNDADADALLAKVSEDTRKLNPKRKRGSAASAAISDEFLSLDALLDTDLELQRKKQARERKLQKLRDECDSSLADPTAALLSGASPLVKLMSAMANNMTSLSADNDVFAANSSSGATAEEKFGYVFAPITEPLPLKRYEPTPTELASDLQCVYRAMATTDDDELGALLWSKAILLRCALSATPKAKAAASANAKAAAEADVTELRSSSSSTTSAALDSAIFVPAKICTWLFTTMSTHSSGHVIRGCLSNLFLALDPAHKTPADLHAGLPSASFCASIENYRALLSAAAGADARLQMAWQPTVYDFLNAFRTFGFHDSKRSMSTKSKIDTTPKRSTPTKTAAPAAAASPATPATGNSSGEGADAPVTLPFPTLNMHYVLMYFVMCLRANVLKLDGYDAFSFTMFFLRMQFESELHPELVQLASICIEELLEVFPKTEWRREWAPSLVLRIAGVHEGLFDSPAGWLTVARRLPRTLRGTQLTTGLCIYVLQHRIDKTPVDGATSERPLKFPIQSGLVLDIVAGIVEDLTLKYTATRASGKKTAPPPYDLLCKKVALMDLALQAFLNILTQKEMALLLKKLDALAGSHKSTMSAKWHELKTLVSLMHRKYSLENLRIGREASPLAKTTLFIDDSAN